MYEPSCFASTTSAPPAYALSAVNCRTWSPFLQFGFAPTVFAVVFTSMGAPWTAR